jgi:hypothetical protein
MLDVINMVRGSNEKWVELLQVWRNSILYPEQNSAPVSLKLRIKSEVRMKTHNTKKKTGDQTSLFSSPQLLLLRGVSPHVLDSPILSVPRLLFIFFIGSKLQQKVSLYAK